MKLIEKNIVIDHVNNMNIYYNESNKNFYFDEHEFVFRIPIGDYRLQLDLRINAAISLLPENGELLLCRKELNWNSSYTTKKQFEAVLDSMGIARFNGAIILSEDERQLLFALIYLTNRWGEGQESFYVIPYGNPELMMYVPSSPVSIFFTTRTREMHDLCVQELAERNVPAYGKLIVEPFKVLDYKNIKIGSTFVKVDPKTGKPIGPGSEESVLLPEFLPPDD